MPGCAAPAKDCGIGFDYRMAMGEPDFWFRLAEKLRDDDWPMGGLFYELTNKRAEEKVVSYVESHDQALVGGKTFFFTLADAAIYWGMGKDQHGLKVDRAVALHKLARLATAALNGGAYLNFMGNEFGHPEWIDFPRQDNGWSYHHARRQWSLRDDPNLRFKPLGDFDETMLAALAKGLKAAKPEQLLANEPDKVLAFVRGDLMFVFNFHPTQSYSDYGVMVPPATKWKHLFDSDEERFGGQGRIASGQSYDPVLVPYQNELVQQIRLYLPARTATVSPACNTVSTAVVTRPLTATCRCAKYDLMVLRLLSDNCSVKKLNKVVLSVTRNNDSFCFFLYGTDTSFSYSFMIKISSFGLCIKYSSRANVSKFSRLELSASSLAWSVAMFCL